MKIKLVNLKPNKSNELKITTNDYVCEYCSPDKLSQILFERHCQAQTRHGFFHARIQKQEYKYKVWYTNFDAEFQNYHNEQIWKDTINDKGDVIKHTYIDDVVDKLFPDDLKETDCRFLVFTRDGDYYKFVGVFKQHSINHNQANLVEIKYVKVADTFTFKRKKVYYSSYLTIEDKEKLGKLLEDIFNDKK